MRGRTLATSTLRFMLSAVLALGPVFANAAPALASRAESGAGEGGSSAAAAEPEVLRELVENRTETSREFLLDNGMIRAEYFAAPIHYRNPATGEFEPVDATLAGARVAGRRVATNKANSFSVQLPDVLTGDWVSIEKGRAKVSLRPAPAGRAGEAEPATATVVARSTEATERVYPNAFAGADLAYESRADGLKETIVVHEPDSGSVFGFDLRLEGLTPRSEADGSISLLASAETTPVFTIPAPYMYDSSETTEGGMPDFGPVRYELSGSAPVWQLDVVCDKEWLSAPERVYPVMIDPSVVTESATPLDTYVSSRGGYQNTNYSSHIYVWTNNHDPAEYWTEYGLVQPGSTLVSDMAAKKADGYKVVASRLRYLVYSVKGAGYVLARRCTTSVNIGTVTWNTRPNFTNTGASPYEYCGTGWKQFDVTEIVRYWQDNSLSASYCTVHLAITDGGHVSFRSDNYSSGRPSFAIDYAPTPVVTRTSPTSGNVTSLPKARWTYSEAQGNPQVEYQVEVALSPGGAPVATTSGTGTATECNLPTPSGGWVVGTTYYVRMRAASSPSTQVPRLWSAWTSAGDFTPALPPPPTVTRTSPTSGDVTSLPNAAWTYSSSLPQLQYQIEVALSPGGAPIATSSGTGTATQCNLPAPPSGWEVATTYYARMRAAGDHTGTFATSPVWSSWTSWGSFRLTQPVVTLTSPTSGSVTALPGASWTYSGPDAQVAYQAEVALTAGGTPITTTSGTGTATECSLPTPPGGWVSGTTYHVRVRAGSSPFGATVWSTWSASGSFTPTLPSPPPAVLATATAGDDWFSEADTNGDGLNDVKNDSASEGRGHVDLAWDPCAGADGYSVYLFDGNTYRKVGDTDSQSWSSAGAHFFPTDTQIAALADGTTANPFRSGDGVGLRDDPRPLYAKTAGESMDATAAYAFRVVPYNEFGEAAVAGAPEALVRLDDRTIGVNDEQRLVTATMVDDMLGHHAEAVLNRAAATLSITDLSIASWGPPAALSRFYDSTALAASTFGPGWRFNFEQAIETSTTTFVDERGERHRFYLRDGTYHGPDGFVADLTREFVGAELGYRLSFKGGDSVLFDAAGRLVADSDHNGNTVVYDRSVSGELSIWAANGQRIVVVFDGERIASATYATSDGTRTVTYSYAPATATAHYFPGTEDDHEIVYTYGSGEGDAGRLRLITMPDYVGDAQPHFDYFNIGQSLAATWGLDYYWTGQLRSWVPPSYYGFFSPGADGWVSYSGRSAVFYIDGQNGANPPEDGARYTWNPTGTVASRTNPENTGTWTYTYDSSGNVVGERWPEGNVLSRTYDARGNVLAETDGQGRTTRYGYENDRVVEETSPRGAKTYYTYTSGNLIREERVLNAAGDRAVTEYSHNASGTVTQQRVKIDPTTWAVTDYSDFALNGEAQTTTHRDVELSVGGPVTDLVSARSYDAFGNQLSEKDASGRWVTKRSVYTISGRLRSSEVVTGTVMHHSYYRAGWTYETSTTAGSEVANRTWAVRDARGRTFYQGVLDAQGDIGPMEQVDTYPSGNPWRITYYRDDRASWEDANERFTYDYSGRLTSSRSRDLDHIEQNKLRLTYDAEGRETLRIEPGNTVGTSTTYSPTGDVLRVDEPDGTWVTYAYDADGNRISETRPAGDGEVTKRFIYDLGGRLVESVDEKGAATTYTYDLAGHQVAAGIGGAGGSTRVLNTAGWELSRTDADGLTTKTAYDGAGRTTRTDVAGKVTEFDYDGAGRLTTQTGPDGAAHHDYDAFLRATRTWHTRGQEIIKDVRTRYDEYSRVLETSETVGAVAKHLVYRSESSGNTERLQHASISYFGASSEIAYSTRGLEANRQVSSGTLGFTCTVGIRDAQGRPTRTTIAGLPAASTAYDAAGRMTAQTGLGWAGAGALYTYGAAGRKTAESLVLAYPDTTFTGAYGYTGEGRLNSATIDGATTTYAHDASGSLSQYRRAGEATTTLAYDAAGRLSQTGTTTFGYDRATGVRTSQRASGETSVTFTFTGADRLRHYSDPNRAMEATYAYDAQGQRISAVVTEGSLTTTLRYTYDGLSLLRLDAARSDESTYSLTYFYDEAARPIAGIYEASDAAPTLFYLITTDRGDVVELLDSNGAPFATYRYDAWGNPIAAGTRTRTTTEITSAALAAAIAFRQVLRYAGYCYDGGTGLYYLSARYYDPATYQFLSKDPAKDDGEESAYQYCGGNPVGGVDPTGLYSQKGFSFTSTVGAWRKYSGPHVYMRITNVRTYARDFSVMLEKKRWWGAQSMGGFNRIPAGGGSRHYLQWNNVGGGTYRFRYSTSWGYYYNGGKSVGKYSVRMDVEFGSKR
ncbi:MAG: RHS repeat protein [Coriobacteriia bacterium]|nr:RHS repeat protein [Coriobacteriia bacterium]